MNFLWMIQPRGVCNTEEGQYFKCVFAILFWKSANNSSAQWLCQIFISYDLNRFFFLNDLFIGKIEKYDCNSTTINNLHERKKKHSFELSFCDKICYALKRYCNLSWEWKYNWKIKFCARNFPIESLYSTVK